jgi:Na+/proline symporter
LLFGVLGIALKKVTPNAHTFAEIVNARWGKTAHITFLFFGFCTNIIVTSMLILGGAATTASLTGMPYELASFLIPWGVILYTVSGGLEATFLATYLHTVLIMVVLVIMITIVYIKRYSSDIIHEKLAQTTAYNETECKIIYSSNQTLEGTFYEAGTYQCGPIEGNYGGSFLTMLSSGGLMFGIINIVGNFGTVFVDNSYWMTAIASRPSAAAKGYMLGGICWFSIPFSLATSLGLTSGALMFPLTKSEAGSGLVPPAVADYLMGGSGGILILIMLFMAITSTGAAESIAVATLVAYDIYRTYFNPQASGEKILLVSRIMIVLYNLFMGCFSIALYYIGLNLGWVYLFMGIVIGGAVIPLWNMMTWSKASGRGAVIAAWSGCASAFASWLIACKIQSGSISVDNLGKEEPMLTGNLFALLFSGLIHVVYSLIWPDNFDMSTLNDKIPLIEQDLSGLGPEERDPKLLKGAYWWIISRGWVLTIILIIAWPALSLPQGVFSQSYFAFWVWISVVWGFCAAMILTFMPIFEAEGEIINFILCKKRGAEEETEEDQAKLEKF